MKKLFSNELVEYLQSVEVTYSPTAQLYFKKFPYKVTLKTLDDAKLMAGHGQYKYLKFSVQLTDIDFAERRLNDFIERARNAIETRKSLKEVVGWLDSNFDPKSFRRYLGHDQTAFYVHDPETVLALCKRFPLVIDRVEGPITETHIEALDNDNNIIIRETLFYNKFRFRCRYTVSSEFLDTQCQPIVDWLKTLDSNDYHAGVFLDLKDRWDTSKVYLSLGYYKNLSIYLNDPEHLVYAKLLSGSSLNEAAEVKLISELK